MAAQERIPAPTERRSAERHGVAEKWSAAQRDAWRLEAFTMQVSQEARARLDREYLRRAVWIGVALGIMGSAVSLFW